MTHDAIAALVALRARLEARLSLTPEFRALKSIEASLRDIEKLGDAPASNATPAVEARATSIDAPMEAGDTTSDTEVPPRHDVNPMARALARGIEHNVAQMKVHRGVGF